MTLDDRTRAALARLTANEKECLRRRLLPQTAKEMAIELGISPHAVEKRLKMARTKLGLSSSLEAARLLARAGDQPLVPRAPDLADAAEAPHAPGHPGGWRRRTIWGLTAMGIIIAAALALTLGGAPAHQDHGERVPATPEQAAAFLGSSFDLMDKDKSGYLEAGEAPRTTVRIGGKDGPLQPVTARQAEAMFFARNDRDGDGKVSRDEFIAANRAVIEAAGIPKRWKPRG